MIINMNLILFTENVSKVYQIFWICINVWLRNFAIV